MIRKEEMWGNVSLKIKHGQCTGTSHTLNKEPPVCPRAPIAAVSHHGGRGREETGQK
jgi:hypothetical protein